MLPSAEAAGVAAHVASVFERAGIEYAIGGALALGMWSEIRATRDVDLAVFLTEEQLERLFLTLEQAGATLERDLCRIQLRKSGYFDVLVDDVRVDLFLPDFELYDWAYPRRKRLPLGPAEAWFWSAEDVLLFKLLFFRTKDKADVETLLAVQRENLDLGYIRRALREIFQEDELTSWFEETVGRVVGGRQGG